MNVPPLHPFLLLLFWIIVESALTSKNHFITNSYALFSLKLSIERLVLPVSCSSTSSDIIGVNFLLFSSIHYPLTYTLFFLALSLYFAPFRTSSSLHLVFRLISKSPSTYIITDLLLVYAQLINVSNHNTADTSWIRRVMKGSFFQRNINSTYKLDAHIYSTSFILNQLTIPVIIYIHHLDLPYLSLYLPLQMRTKKGKDPTLY